ncbi:hypothetical protein [Phaffia rhodozyma]|uniref:Uncharacterized protein n=1 Tax=Phaffia rhodozyma TaxID=264483 RepID=A0A0F7SR75_PHARH|nr:hypothetical protein [Phaffia rhodozyma]
MHPRGIARKFPILTISLVCSFRVISRCGLTANLSRTQIRVAYGEWKPLSEYTTHPVLLNLHGYFDSWNYQAKDVLLGEVSVNRIRIIDNGDTLITKLSPRGKAASLPSKAGQKKASSTVLSILQISIR